MLQCSVDATGPLLLVKINFLIRSNSIRTVWVEVKGLWQDFEMGVATKSRCNFMV